MNQTKSVLKKEIREIAEERGVPVKIGPHATEEQLQNLLESMKRKLKEEKKKEKEALEAMNPYNTNGKNTGGMGPAGDAGF